jgi:hypothetical protein
MLDKNKKHSFLIYVQIICLSIFDNLLTKIFDGEFEVSINDLSKDLSTKANETTDLENIILYEIILKNNQFLKEYFFHRLTKIFDCCKEEIFNVINSFSCDITIKSDLQKTTQSLFRDLISNRCIRLLTSIDEFYVDSFNRSNTVKNKAMDNIRRKRFEDQDTTIMLDQLMLSMANVRVSNVIFY